MLAATYEVPRPLRRMILGYKHVQGGFEGTSVRKEAAKEESDVLNERRKISTASPAPTSMWQFVELSRGRRYGRLSTAIANTDRVAAHGKLLFSSSFELYVTPAVDAVGLSHELYLMAYRRSPCILLLPGQYRDARDQRLHPP
jgi:hypothetical protein